MTRNWEEIGIVWEADDVSKQYGDHATDRKVIAVAQLPRISDIDKAQAAGIDILGWVNSSNSMRVRAQAIARANPKLDAEALREEVFKALLGQRNVGGGRTTVITKRPLPGGVMYEGNDETEFRQLYTAALVDQGVAADTARTIVSTITW